MVDSGTSTLWLGSDCLFDYAIQSEISFELNVMTEDILYVEVFYVVSFKISYKV